MFGNPLIAIDQFIIKDPYKLPLTCCKVICCPQFSAWIPSISLVTGSEDEAETNLWCPAMYDKSGNADDLNERKLIPNSH